ILRNRLEQILKDHRLTSGYGDLILTRPWSRILHDVRVYHQHRLGPFREGFEESVAEVKKIIAEGTYSDVLGWLEFVLKHTACPPDFPRQVDDIMTYCRLAYRVFDRTVICPIGSDAEGETIRRAFSDL